MPPYVKRITFASKRHGQPLGELGPQDGHRRRAYYRHRSENARFVASLLAAKPEKGRVALSVKGKASLMAQATFRRTSSHVINA